MGQNEDKNLYYQSKYLRYMPKTTIIELNVGKYALLYGMAHMPGARIIATTQREAKKICKKYEQEGKMDSFGASRGRRKKRLGDLLIEAWLD